MAASVRRWLGPLSTVVVRRGLLSLFLFWFHHHGIAYLRQMSRRSGGRPA